MIATRLAELELELKPEGTRQHDEVQAIASASIRLERCQAEEQACRLRRAERAEFYWHADHEAEVMRLVQRLPKKPDLIVSKLRQSLHGCMWMLNEWHSLAGLVRGTSAGGSPRPLDEVGRRRAGDLLGLSAERRLGPTQLDLPGGARSEADLAEHQRSLIATQIAALEKLTGWDRIALDESIRVETMNGINLTVDDQVRLIRRYETEARRVKDRAYANLQRLKDEAAALQEAARLRERAQRFAAWEREVEDLSPLMRGDVESPATLRSGPQPEPEPEPETQPDGCQAAPVEAVEAAPVSPADAVAERLAVLQETPGLPLNTDAPTVLLPPVHRRLSRHARKAMAARAAHRTLG